MPGMYITWLYKMLSLFSSLHWLDDYSREETAYFHTDTIMCQQQGEPKT